MSDLKKKILERSGFRVYVRKVVSTVRELLQEEDVENIRPTLESHKINLEKQQKQIETLNQEIAELVGADAIEKEILDRCEFEASLQETISLISSRLSFAKESNQRKTIVNSWVRCVENNQLVITSGFPTVNFRKLEPLRGTYRGPVGHGIA